MHDGLLEDLLVADVGLDQSPEAGHHGVCLLVELEEGEKHINPLRLQTTFPILAIMSLCDVRAADVSCRAGLWPAINSSNYNLPLTEQVHPKHWCKPAERNPAKVISPVSSHPIN